MANLEGFDFFALHFDSEGRLLNPDEWNSFKQQAASATDAIFLAHGFRNDENEARALYGGFLRNFRSNAARQELKDSLGSRKFVVAGVFWPSKTFRESFGTDGGGVQSFGDDDEAQREAARAQLEALRELKPEESAKIDEAIRLLGELKDDPGKQDEFVGTVLSLVDDSHLGPNEGLDRVRAQPGSELLDKLKFPIILPTSEQDEEGGVSSLGDAAAFGEGGTQGIGSFVGSVFGRVGQFLNLTTWYIMKNRCGVVGENDVAQAVRDLRRNLPKVRVHLVGHSLGGRLMAGCAKSLAQDPVVHVDSLTLLEAAFSHFGLSADNRLGTAGYFRDIITKKVVTGPLVATFSFQDTVVGYAYAVASRLAGDNVRAIGDANDPFGGIGRNGAQNCDEAVTERLHTAGTPYRMRGEVVLCLDGSGGLIRDHGDVTNENVTYAFASAVAATQARVAAP
jgi:hypothetical protein